MKLPLPASPLSLAAKLAEFDAWITPALAEIKDSDKFKDEIRKVVSIFDALATATQNFRDLADCTPAKITEGILNLIAGKAKGAAFATLDEAASLLFLVTGKTDNNAKCQFPIHLKDKARWQSYPVAPKASGAKSATALSQPGVAIPRVLKSEMFLGLVSAFGANRPEQYRILLEYIKFLISDEQYQAQLWALGASYVKMRALGHGQALLSSLVIFKVRGSASASGGHEPEKIMRCLFDHLGLQAGTDYNVRDVVVADLPGGTANPDAEKEKTRAYDFVLPYQVPTWPQRLFIQAQFYAGDSGSVSHKTVDQTTTSRSKVRTQNENPVFLEYIDGAGYFSALNGDLKKIFGKPDTHDFTQIRSAPLRLRRALQQIGFLTPLEIEHAVARTKTGVVAEVSQILLAESYAQAEIDRALTAALAANLLARIRNKLTIMPERQAFARRMFFLDTIARQGAAFSNGCQPGCYLVPGFGDFYGLKHTDALNHVLKAAPLFEAAFSSSVILMADVQWLEQKRYLMSC